RLIKDSLKCNHTRFRHTKQRSLLPTGAGADMLYRQDISRWNPNSRQAFISLFPHFNDYVLFNDCNARQAPALCCIRNSEGPQCVREAIGSNIPTTPGGGTAWHCPPMPPSSQHT
ncbi:hypothetical protein ATANTOWER_026176, partial [Ataeniobius toweri]|nr:hypothetical protein [Ataeniobius toweri]